MNPEDPLPSNDYTALAVQLGVIQEGQRHTLQGVNDIKDTLNRHGDRLGHVELAVGVVKERVDAHDTILTENRLDSKPLKGRWANYISALSGIVAIVIVILDRLYAPAAH
jgi:hypothetical protein